MKAAQHTPAAQAAGEAGAITPSAYNAWQEAYDFLNDHLFASSLPDVLVTLQRHHGARGYFAPERFGARGGATLAAVFTGQKAVHELAMNPDTFADRTDEEILSTLAHEMAHVWQQSHGRAPRRCYHDKQWAEKMKEIGLQPTDTGEPGGKETGQRVTHIIVQGGRYQRAYTKLAARGFRLRWQSQPEPAAAKKKAASKTKYTCPECGANAWAKPETELLCGECSEGRNHVAMIAEDADD
jgi:predicted SprT family Zn-dependent metalloprotease